MRDSEESQDEQPDSGPSVSESSTPKEPPKAPTFDPERVQKSTKKSVTPSKGKQKMKRKYHEQQEGHSGYVTFQDTIAKQKLPSHMRKFADSTSNSKRTQIKVKTGSQMAGTRFSSHSRTPLKTRMVLSSGDDDELVSGSAALPMIEISRRHLREVYRVLNIAKSAWNHYHKSYFGLYLNIIISQDIRMDRLLLVQSSLFTGIRPENWDISPKKKKELEKLYGATLTAIASPGTGPSTGGGSGSGGPNDPLPPNRRQFVQEEPRRRRRRVEIQTEPPSSSGGSGSSSSSAPVRQVMSIADEFVVGAESDNEEESGANEDGNPESDDEINYGAPPALETEYRPPEESEEEESDEEEEEEDNASEDSNSPFLRKRSQKKSQSKSYTPRKDSESEGESEEDEFPDIPHQFEQVNDEEIAFAKYSPGRVRTDLSKRTTFWNPGSGDHQVFTLSDLVDEQDQHDIPSQWKTMPIATGAKTTGRSSLWHGIAKTSLGNDPYLKQRMMNYYKYGNILQTLKIVQDPIFTGDIDNALKTPVLSGAEQVALMCCSTEVIGMHLKDAQPYHFYRDREARAAFGTLVAKAILLGQSPINPNQFANSQSQLTQQYRDLIFKVCACVWRYDAGKERYLEYSVERWDDNISILVNSSMDRVVSSERSLYRGRSSAVDVCKQRMANDFGGGMGLAPRAYQGLPEDGSGRSLIGSNRGLPKW